MPADGEGNETPQFLLKTSPVRGVRKKKAAQPCFHPCTPAQRETNLTCPGFCRLLTKAKTQQSSPREISQLKTTVQVRSFPKAPFFLGGGKKERSTAALFHAVPGQTAVLVPRLNPWNCPKNGTIPMLGSLSWAAGGSSIPAVPHTLGSHTPVPLQPLSEAFWHRWVVARLS